MSDLIPLGYYNNPITSIPEDWIRSKSKEGYLELDIPKIGMGYISCCVCRCWVAEFEAIRVKSGIVSPHYIEHNSRYYIIPSFHESCRDLFQLNPLAYETLYR